MTEATETKITQRVIDYLKALGFTQLATEAEVRLGKHGVGRADIVAFDRNEQPLLVVEVKTHLEDSLSMFHPAVDQAFSFARSLRAKYILVTDSTRFFWYQIRDTEEKQLVELASPPMPDVEDRLATHGYPTVAFRKPEDLEQPIWRIYDKLRGQVPTEMATNILMELLLAKYQDERLIEEQKPQDFQVLPGEEPEKTKSRIIDLVRRALSSIQYEDVALEKLDSRLVQSLVLEIQSYRLGSPNLDSVFSRLMRQTSGQLFTPRVIVDAIASMFDFTPDDCILDPAAGTGAFLSATLAKAKAKNDTPKVIGIERDAQAASIARMNLFMTGLPAPQILAGDFLRDGVQGQLRELGFAEFDYILANPPFGESYRVQDYGALPAEISSRSRSLPTESLYLLRIIALLGPGKRAAIIVPEGLLFRAHEESLRKYILSVAHLRAIISLPAGVSQPTTRVKTSLLVLQKKGPATADGPTLMMRVREPREGAHRMEGVDRDSLALAVATYRDFISTGKVKREARLQLSATLVEGFSADNGYRLDFAAYAPEYMSILEKLERGPYRLVRLGDIADIRLGERVRREDSGWTQVITTSNIRPEGLMLSPESFTSAKVSPRKHIKLGDLIMSGRGRDCLVVTVPEDFPDAVPSDPLIVISLKPDVEVRQEYLFALLQHELFKVQLDHMAIGMSVRRVVPSLLADVRVPILPLSEQEVVVRHMREVKRYRALASETFDQVKAMIGKALGEENDEA